MPNILIRDVPKQTVDLAKELAVRHRRTLQKELAQILEDGVKFYSGAWSETADKIRHGLEQKHIKYSDSSILIREDRRR